MLPAIPVLVASAFLALLALTSNQAISQALISTPIAFHGYQFTRAVILSHPDIIYTLPARTLTQVRGGLQITQPTDLILYAAPVGALTWQSSPALRHVFRAGTSLLRRHITPLRQTASKLLGPVQVLLISDSPAYHNIPTLGPLPITLTKANRFTRGSKLLIFKWQRVWITPLLALPAPVVRPNTCTASAFGACGVEAKDATSVAVHTAPTLQPDICTASVLGMCGLGHEQGDTYSRPLSNTRDFPRTSTRSLISARNNPRRLEESFALWSLVFICFFWVYHYDFAAIPDPSLAILGVAEIPPNQDVIGSEKSPVECSRQAKVQTMLDQESSAGELLTGSSVDQTLLDGRSVDKTLSRGTRLPTSVPTAALAQRGQKWVRPWIRRIDDPQK